MIYREIKLVFKRRRLPCPKIDGPDAVVPIFRSLVDRESLRESFVSFLLDTKNSLIGVEVQAVGGQGSVEISPTEIFVAACKMAATGIVIAHNHPSGDPSPSAADDALTTRLGEASKLLGISFVDHLILGDQRYWSYAGRRTSRTSRLESS